jgi:hypothetical protein
MQFLLLALLCSALGLTGSPRALAATCPSLRSVHPEHATVQSASLIQTGQFTALLSPSPFAAAGAAPAEPQHFLDLPAFCRILGVIATSPTTQIHFEIWLPERSSWNGRFMVEGFAFYGGTMDPRVLADALRRGYATATTDLGGDGTLHAAYLLHQPQRLIDWDQRGWHDTTLIAKRLIAAFYGQGPAFSYWNACGGALPNGLRCTGRRWVVQWHHFFHVRADLALAGHPSLGRKPDPAEQARAAASGGAAQLRGTRCSPGRYPQRPRALPVRPGTTAMSLG